MQQASVGQHQDVESSRLTSIVPTEVDPFSNLLFVAQAAFHKINIITVDIASGSQNLFKEIATGKQEQEAAGR